MRLAFHPVLSAHVLKVSFFDASTVSQEGADAKPLASVEFQKNGKKWLHVGVSWTSILSKSDLLVIKKLAKANVASLSEATEKDGYTPLVFLRALLAQGSVQIVWDASQKKYRCVSTMTEGSDAYEVLGVGATWTIEAKDEETAVRIAKKEVANEMADAPEKAAKLVGFFTGGCKVKKVTSGALPEFLKIESLAASPEEEKLAKTPIKKVMKDSDKDDDKE